MFCVSGEFSCHRNSSWEAPPAASLPHTTRPHTFHHHPNTTWWGHLSPHQPPSHPQLLQGQHSLPHVPQVVGNRTGGHTACARSLCAHRTTAGFLHCSSWQQASWKRPAGEESLVAWQQKPSAKLWNYKSKCCLSQLCCSEAFGLFILLLLWLRAIKDLEPTQKSLWPKESSAFRKEKSYPWHGSENQRHSLIYLIFEISILYNIYR